MSLPAVAVSQSPEEKFREFLASRPTPRRYTQPQREILRHVFAHHQHFDTAQLLDNLQQAGATVSRPTVYRTLAELVEAGLLRKIEIGRRTVYDHDYGYPWHEHLVCDECGDIVEFQHPAIEAALREVASQYQFREAGHTLVVRGVCAQCNAATAAARRRYMM